MDAIHAGTIRGMYIEGENPAMSDPDLNHAREALAKLEHLVVQDLFLTETAFHADVVLPASAFAEKSGTFTNTDRRVQIAQPILDLPGDARQDWWIIQEIARRMGLDWRYQGPADVYAELASLSPLVNISWERLERERSVTYPCEAPDKPGTRSSSRRVSRRRPAAAGLFPRTFNRQTSCPMRPIRWCSQLGACWSTGTPAP